jgi:hypothetical protein
MDGNQDREFRRSVYVYPNPRDSRIVEPNPPYDPVTCPEGFHPPIYFIGGAFWADDKATVTVEVNDVPDYILDTIAGEHLAAAPPKPRMTLTAKPEDYERTGGRMGADALLHDLAVANAAEVAPKRNPLRAKRDALPQ